MRLIDVYDFLKTRCPNHKVSHGFDWNYGLNYNAKYDYNDIYFKMVENITVSAMVGNLSHAINAGHGMCRMMWPERPNSLFVEEVTIETLEEMGMKPNT